MQTLDFGLNELGGSVPSESGNGLTALPPVPAGAMIVVPLRNAVLFPASISPISVGRDTSIAAVREAARTGSRIAFVLQRDPETNEPGRADLHDVATSGQILRMGSGDQGVHLVVQGHERVRVLEFLTGWPFHVARIEAVPSSEESVPMQPEIEARFMQLKELAFEAIRLLPGVPAEYAQALQGIDSPGQLCDLVANLIDISNEEKQQVLESFELRTRLDKVLALLGSRVEVLRLSKEISDKTRKEFDEKQKEFVLREQLRQIQKELGEGEDREDLDELAKSLDDAGMPEETLKHAKKELARLSRMGESSPEASMIRSYLDYMAELPWKLEEEPSIDIAAARRILDEDHYGLDKIKRRILEFLAVRKLHPEGKSPILCFVGPPGVGKTSLGHSIARAIGKPFERIALGGTHDEAEIRGHRRTYIGALPGNIIQALRRAGSRRSVLMLDEIDKLGSGGFHGDPASAMLEVLDPEQNSKFRDNYLAVDFDLSRVMFIATANSLDTIPGPLRDRMEIIQLPGYTEQEKLEIASRYLVARQLEANGLKPEQASIDADALRVLVHDYTREAGVRNLEREIGSALRSAAMSIAEHGFERVDIDVARLRVILGAPKFENEVAQRTSVPGVATGLAWTPVGGDILFVEASKVPGSGKLILTGQLGEVMKESAQAAVTLAKTFTGDALDKIDLHIHVPAGATPKDGPSAGVAIYLALVSLLTGRTVRPDVAMTGEISLRGLVMPIGGVKEKLLAALRAGITTVMLPRRNQKDLEDLPADARERLRVVLLDHVEDAVACAIEGCSTVELSHVA